MNEIQHLRLDDAVAVYEQLVDEDPDAALHATVSQYPDLEAELRQHAKIHQRVHAVSAPLRRAAMTLRSPPVIGGYEDICEIGRGGMGVVYRARESSTGRVVAIKTIRPERLASLEPGERQHLVDRFRTEAMAAADHEHIVRIYYTGENQGEPYLVMEYVRGVTLREFIDEEPLLEEVIQYMHQAAVAVHHAHTHGVLHRDIKPANILIDRQAGVARVADFGLAKLALAPNDPATGAQVVLGTLPYMSPEQLADSREVTVASDIYSLGATLFESVTGQPPFRGSRGGVAAAIAGSPPPAPSDINPALPRKLDKICRKCLQKDPGDRYQTAAELADALDDLRSVQGDAAILFARMSWLLILFAFLSGLIHCGVFWLLSNNASEWLIWTSLFAIYPPLFGMFWLTPAPRWRDSRAARRELWSIWIGHLFATSISAVAFRWNLSRLAESVPLTYVIMAAASGMALFSMGANFWRFHYLLGIGWMAIAFMTAAAPAYGPLWFAAGAASCSIIIGLYELYLAREQVLDIKLKLPASNSRSSASIRFPFRPDSDTRKPRA